MDRLERHAPALDRIETRPDAAETRDLVRGRLGSDLERVFVLGGDGVVGDVAGALVDSGVPLGIIPTGTTNVVAAELGIPASPGPAFRALSSSTSTRRFHTWSAGGGTLVLGASAGFDAEIMRNVNGRLKARVGYLALVLAGLETLVRHESPQLMISGIDYEGAPIELEGTSVIATNTKRYGRRGVTVPAADPEDDLLDVIVGTTTSRLEILAFWMRFLAGGSWHLKSHGVRYVRLRSLRAEARGPVQAEVQINGDAVGRMILDVAPAGYIDLLVPQTLR